MRIPHLLLTDYRLQGVILGSGPDLPPADTLGSSLGTWMRQNGGQLKIIETGATLTGGDVDILGCVHNFDATKPRNGWLVIAAQTRRTVTVDLSTTGLNLSYNGPAHAFARLELRILFVGIKFTFGMLTPEWVKYCRFYDCDFTNPVEEWNTNQYIPAYTAKHGTAPVLGGNIDLNTGMANPFPTIARGGFADNIEFYFCDFHNVGDHLFFQNSCADWVMQGCNAWDVFHHGINYWNPALNTDIFHNGLLCQSSSIKVYDCGMFFNFEADTNPGGGSCSIDIRRFWSFGSYGVGFQFTEESSHLVTGQIRGPALWGAHGQFAAPWLYDGLPRYSADFDAFQYTVKPESQGEFVFPDNLTFYDGSGNVISGGAFVNQYHATVAGWPSGVSTIGGILTDLANAPASPYPNIPSLVDHPLNPANIDRAAPGHGPGDWDTYLTAAGWS